MNIASRKVLAALAVCVVLTTACQARTDTRGGDGPVDGSASAAAAVPQAEVLQAVQSATALTQLPASVSNADLLAASGDDEDAWKVPDCDPALEATSIEDLGPCTMGDVDGDRTLVLIGDSAAAMWHSAFDQIGQRNGIKVIVLTKNNCGPAELTYYQYQLNREFTECDDWREWRMGVIADEQPDIVVLAGWYGGNLGPDRQLTPEVWRDGLVATANMLPSGTKVVMLNNQPHPDEVPAECVVNNPGNVSDCALPADQAVPDQSGWSAAAQQVGATYVDVTPWFCTTTCPAIIGDHIVYAGQYHITLDYGRYVSGSLEEAIAPVLTS